MIIVFIGASLIVTTRFPVVGEQLILLSVVRWLTILVLGSSDCGVLMVLAGRLASSALSVVKLIRIVRGGGFSALAIGQLILRG